MKQTAEFSKRFRMTRQREIILKVLKSVYTHPTADELYQMVRRQIPKISLGTVYRNLDVLHEQGLVLRLDTGGGQRHFDGHTSPHHHAVCTSCHHLIDIPVEMISPVEIHLTDSSEFQLTEYRLELLGICRQCREKEAAQN